MKNLTPEELKENLKNKDFDFKIRKFGYEGVSFDALIPVSKEIYGKLYQVGTIPSLSEKLNLTNFRTSLTFEQMKPSIDEINFIYHISAEKINTLIKIINYLELNISNKIREELKNILKKDCDVIEESLKMLAERVELKAIEGKSFCIECGAIDIDGDALCYSCYYGNSPDLANKCYSDI